MDWLVIAKLVVGLVLLVFGAEWLVRGASRLALRLGMAPLVIGLTVVAYGTSAPELAIGVDAALGGTPDIALGNVVGSNIANVLLILGIAALATPLVVQRQLVWLDVPVMVGLSLLVWWMAANGAVGRLEGALLIALGVGYTVLQVWLARRTGAPDAGTTAAEGLEDVAPDDAPAWRHVLLLVVGLALLVAGARWLVESAVGIAGALGIDDLIIGLTVVAVGTSLPEIATSLLAVRRGQGDLAVGNVVGSNVFNLLVVLGGTAAIAPGGIGVSAAALNFDLPVMTAVAVACLPIFFTGHCIQRWEGAVFLGYYVAYTAYLLLDSTGHDALDEYSLVMAAFVLPLTVLTLLVVTVRAWRTRKESPP